MVERDDSFSHFWELRWHLITVSSVNGASACIWCDGCDPFVDYLSFVRFYFCSVEYRVQLRIIFATISKYYTGHWGVGLSAGHFFFCIIFTLSVYLYNKLFFIFYDRTSKYAFLGIIFTLSVCLYRSNSFFFFLRSYAFRVLRCRGSMLYTWNAAVVNQRGGVDVFSSSETGLSSQGWCCYRAYLPLLLEGAVKPERRLMVYVLLSDHCLGSYLDLQRVRFVGQYDMWVRNNGQ